MADLNARLTFLNEARTGPDHLNYVKASDPRARKQKFPNRDV